MPEQDRAGLLDRLRRSKVGMRNIKTALAVCICILLYEATGGNGVLMAAIAAIVCMQDTIDRSIRNGMIRVVSTVIGGLIGGLFLWISSLTDSISYAVLSVAGTVLLIYLCNLFSLQDGIVIALVAFLTIILEQADANPILYSMSTVLDTLVGVTVGVTVNRLIRNPGYSEQAARREEQARNDLREIAPKLSHQIQRKRMGKMYGDLMDTIGFVSSQDPEVGAAMGQELLRQRRNLELIASENLVSPAVMAAMGSVLTNKYAEGYPKKRYYGGCECVDVVEQIAIDRAKALFGADHANVQAHSGAQANMAAYMALIKPGDTVLGMNLAHGGHLTHGSPVNFSGQLYNFVAYGVDSQTGRIDYGKLREQALEAKPRLIVAGASAYSRIIDFERISEIAKEAGAYFLVDMAHIAGLVAAGQHPSPVPCADIVTTTTHKTLRGPRGGLILCKEEFAKAVDKAVFPGTQGGPLLHIIAAKAVCFGEAMAGSFKAYQAQIVKNCAVLAEALLGKGFHLVSGGTDNHLILIDLREMGITGKELEKRLDEVRITVNKNAVPDDPQSPFVTSGIRIGTAAVTTRGLVEKDMEVIADCIYKAAVDFENQAAAIREAVEAVCAKYPLYQ